MTLGSGPATATDLARYIDHTLLKPEATAAHVEALCEEAVRYGFFAVCVNPVHVRFARNLVDRCSRNVESMQRPVVASVAGFPLGASRTETKADEAARALDDGATEIDMVVNLGALMAGDVSTVSEDILAVAHVVHRQRNGILKVILEVGALSKEQIILGCRCCAQGEADFTKTSTGFHPSGGATVDQVRVLHRHSSPLRVKASGGIRTSAQTLAMIEAGAMRIGTSSGVAIVEEFSRNASHPLETARRSP